MRELKFRTLIVFVFMLHFFLLTNLSAQDLPEELFAEGDSALLNGDYENALHYYSEYIKIVDNNPKAYLNRGVVNVSLKNYRDALDDYSIAIELDSDNSGAYASRGSLFIILEDYTNAK
ncbi:MAG: tetratricopeptide repeat protein, partial [Bacteroidetes bacterium]|nr:tetratricopeptide repeat protein [Bacteroidota bacterium]